MANWGEDELNAALSAHPRIGEKPTGCQAHAALSRQEQSSVDSENERLAQALREGNARYEARFGRVFLIRAKGRVSACNISSPLRPLARIKNTRPKRAS